MYSYEWDEETGGLLLNTSPLQFSKEPRPVYYRELDILGFDKYWNYEKDDTYPYMWAEANNYWYRGRKVAKTSGGALYTAPEIVLIEDPEPDGTPLRFVEIPKMVEKNREIMESLVQETIKKVFNTYNKYKKKVDVFYVAFSGGKDSVVTLDIVQRALPHNEFDVLFGNTDMEFPTTLELVKQIEKFCINKKISFYEAKSNMSSKDSWKLFGPPARKVRWCCTVHKTAPVINKLCDIYSMDKIHSMMITGVRGDESIARSDYDELSLGKKLAGQYSFHPILEWSSVEVYLYIYDRKLFFNEAYKYGFNRVGCIMCPNSSEKHEYIKRQFFKEQVDEYSNLIINSSKKDLSGNNAKLFLEIGGWKTRLSGRELKFSEDERFMLEDQHGIHYFYIKKINDNWKIWYKTVGQLIEEDDCYYLEYHGVWRICDIISNNKEHIMRIEGINKDKNSIEFLYLFKRILIKSLYCIECGTCIAECPNRSITMNNGVLNISDKCVRCHACLKIANGCLYYNSIKGSKNMSNVKGINRYLSVGVDADWIKSYFKDNSYEPGNRKSDVMFSFLKDAGVLKNRKFTDFGNVISEMFEQSSSLEVPWALMLCNLAYSPSFGWYIKNIPFYETYTDKHLELALGDDAKKKAKSEFWNGFKVILDSNESLRTIGFGLPDITRKTTKSGEVKRSMNSLTRGAWLNPDPNVILYSLYKFAEACGDYYSFTLSRLLDHEVDSDGVSPTQIFGLDKETMKQLLTALSVNHPEFISVSFTLGLDNITLKSDKTSDDVLALF